MVLTSLRKRADKSSRPVDFLISRLDRCDGTSDSEIWVNENPSISGGTTKQSAWLHWGVNATVWQKSLIELGVGSIPVFSYFLDILFKLIKYSYIKIKTENQIIETSKYQTVINQVTKWHVFQNVREYQRVKV